MSKSKHLQLRRLLSRKQIAAWLGAFEALEPSVALAVLQPDGRVFAQAGEWPEKQAAEIAEQNLPELEDGLALVEGVVHFPLPLAGVTVGKLVARGKDEEKTWALAGLAGKSLALLLAEAHEKRALAAEALDRYRELNLLYRIGESISATLDPEVILSLVLGESRQIIDADFGLLLLKDAEAEWSTASSFGDQISDDSSRTMISFVTDEYETNNRPAIITDLPEASFGGESPSIASLLWGPLATADRFLGGVLLGRVEGRPVFLANDQKLLSALTNPAAIALEQALLFEEARTSAQHLRELNAIGRELLGNLEWEPVLHRILRAAIELTHAEEGAIFMIEEPSKELVFSVVEGSEEELKGMRLPFGKGIVGLAAESGEAQIVNNVQENKAWFSGVDEAREFTTRSVLAVPLNKQGEVIGVLEVINRQDEGFFSQQDADRLTALTSQAVVAIETARLHQEELTKQRMERELQLGHAMQSSLIPSAVPELAGWEFAAWWQPAREVSGDFYDFIELDSDLGLVMADVADKGVQAALFMALTRSTVRASLNALRKPAAGISEANRLIAQDAARGMFVTLCCAQLHPNSGDVTYVNAGHNPPLWYRSASRSLVELEPTGIFLGIDAGLPFEEKTIRCVPGDILLFYTDGITEAMNRERLQFGEERLSALLLEGCDLAAGELQELIESSLRQHVGETPQSDDITLVIAKRT